MEKANDLIIESSRGRPALLFLTMKDRSSQGPFLVVEIPVQCVRRDMGQINI
jgi:hypothetical protein